MKTSLIISTYNWPEALELCLQSIRNLTMLPNEIIIADDGSGPETTRLIKQKQEDFPVPIVHIWHEDSGFRLAEIRNKAILAASNEYIIQIDGDLILHPDFLKDHINLASKKAFVTGSRMLLTEKYSERILSQKKNPSYLSLFLNGKNRLNAVRIPFLTSNLSSQYKKKDPYYVKGCNMAFWKQDLLDVNGYNESMVGWGKEDSELAVRLINNGVKRLFIKFGGICYHIYHKEASRNNEALNNSVLEKAIMEGRVKSPQGLDSHL